MFEKISAIKEIHSIKDAEEVFFKKYKLSGDIADRLQELDHLLNRLLSFGVSNYITIDFSIVRRLAYCTGFVFKFLKNLGNQVNLMEIVDMIIYFKNLDMKYCHV